MACRLGTGRERLGSCFERRLGFTSSDTDSTGEVSRSQSWTVGLEGTMYSWRGTLMGVTYDP